MTIGRNIKYSLNGSRQHLTCTFMLTYLRCRTLFDTNVILTMPLWLSELGLCYAQNKNSKFKNKQHRGCLFRADDTVT